MPISPRAYLHLLAFDNFFQNCNFGVSRHYGMILFQSCKSYLEPFLRLLTEPRHPRRSVLPVCELEFEDAAGNSCHVTSFWDIEIIRNKTTKILHFLKDLPHKQNFWLFISNLWFLLIRFCFKSRLKGSSSKN